MRIKGIKGRKSLLEIKNSKNKFKCLFFFAKFSKAEDFRCTICITKKSGSAVVRNKIRRWFRSSLQNQQKIHNLNLHMFLFVLPIAIDFECVEYNIRKLFIFINKNEIKERI